MADNLILDAENLRSAAKGGLINEDVMQKIWDISRIPLPFSDMLGTETAKNNLKEWVIDKLAAPNASNAIIDGATAASMTNNAGVGSRVGNYCQISTKKVEVSTRAQDVDSVGDTGSLAYQIRQRQRELRRDIEHISLSNQASVKGDPDHTTTPTAGKAGGFDAWLKTNDFNGAGGSSGGFNTSTGVVDAAVPGTTRALTETLVRDMLQAAYTEGGDPTVLMSVPAVIRKFSEYLFTSSARVGTITTDTQGRNQATAVGAVNVFVSDFGVLELEDNRLQPTYDTGAAASLFAIDPNYVSRIWLSRPQVIEMAKAGLSDVRVMMADWSLMVQNEAAHGVVRAVSLTSAVTAS